MLHWAIILFIVGLVASLFGFGGLAGAAFGVAKGLVALKVIGIVLLLLGIGFFVSHLGGRGSRSLP